MRDEDLTARARLRDAGIALIAEGGTRALTARAVSERAGVSQGLVRHHFGSMAGLLQACDEHVAEEIRSGKRDAIDPSSGFDPTSKMFWKTDPMTCGKTHALKTASVLAQCAASGIRLST